MEMGTFIILPWGRDHALRAAVMDLGAGEQQQRRDDQAPLGDRGNRALDRGAIAAGRERATRALTFQDADRTLARGAIATRADPRVTGEAAGLAAGQTLDPEIQIVARHALGLGHVVEARAVELATTAKVIGERSRRRQRVQRDKRRKKMPAFHVKSPI